MTENDKFSKDKTNDDALRPEEKDYESTEQDEKKLSVFDAAAVISEPTPEKTSEESQPKTFQRRQKPVGDSIYSDVRSICVKILTRVSRTDAYLDKVIDFEIKNETLNDYDKSLLNEICHGVIRWMRRLDWFLNGFYRGNYEKCLPEVKNALRVALYQILFLNKIPDYAAVNEAVDFVKRFSTQKHADVVNGLLRTIIRTKDKLVWPTREIDEVKYLGLAQSHPNWMIKKWIKRYGFDEAERLTIANNKRPILTLRINTLKISKKDFIETFTDRNMAYRFCKYIDYFFTLRLMSKIYLDEDFREGRFAVQDESAGLPSILLSPNENDTVLDMAAAPGGKATHMAQLMNNKGKIFAVDKYESRIRVMEKNSERLGVKNIEFVQDDSMNFENEMITSQKFDKILLDAPCSGLGVLSKKPDIRWKREPEDILRLQDVQSTMLENASKLLKPGGAIVYSTCTIEPEENQDIIIEFLKNHPEFEIDNAAKYVHRELVNESGFIQTMPHTHNIDGSFAVRLVYKNS